MDTESIVRQIKIALITGEKNSIVECFREIYNNLLVIDNVITIERSDDHYIYYYPDSYQWVFYRNDKRKRFYVHTGFMDIFNMGFGLMYDDMRAILPIIFESICHKSFEDYTTSFYRHHSDIHMGLLYHHAVPGKDIF